MGRQSALAVGLIACALVLVGTILHSHDASMPAPDIRPVPRTKSVPLNHKGKPPVSLGRKGTLSKSLRRKGTTLEGSILKTRANSVANNCKEMHEPGQKGIGSRPSNQLLVNDRYKLIFCYIPKVASSNLKRLYLVLGKFIQRKDVSKISADEVNSNFWKIRNLASFSESERRIRLKTYKKIINTREPFERLVSAYHSKFEKGKEGKVEVEWDRKMKQYILNTLTRNGPTREKHLTFVKFIRFLVQEKSRRPEWDFHWATYTDLCNPCHVRYDYVANYDTIDIDMHLILDDIGADVEFPRKPRTYKNATLTSRSLLEEYYKDVPPAHIKQLKKIYATDARLFGYSFPDVLSKLIGER